MSYLKIFFIVIFSFSFSAFSSLALAASSSNDEINHLLNFVASTSCEYERNGVRHNGKEAVEHINKKYSYYANDIKTAEDFIQYSATKSLMSDRHYKVHCNNDDPVKSQDWLLNELKAYRQSR